MKLYSIVKKRIKTKKQILIVDSEQNILKLLYAVLSHEYDLVVKTSAIEAIKWLELGNNPSLIITEYLLPFIDGALFVKHLKYSGFYQSIPVIMLSDVHELPSKIDYMAFNIGAVISKPFNPSYLTATINKLINEYHPTSAWYTSGTVCCPAN